MNLPFIKPVYDSLLRGKELVFSADLSFLSKTFSNDNTFTTYSSPPIVKPDQHINELKTIGIRRVDRTVTADTSVWRSEKTTGLDCLSSGDGEPSPENTRSPSLLRRSGLLVPS